jgi:hypothetical protein
LLLNLPRDQQFLDRLFEEARLHVQAGVYASRPWPFETILVSILIEHEKALVELRSKLRILEEQEKDQKIKWCLAQIVEDT